MGTEQDSATHVWTTRGLMPVSSLIMERGVDDTAHQVTEWTQFVAYDGEVVRRDVHVTMKPGEIGNFW